MDSTLGDVFGTLGAVFWSVQLLPQIILNFRRRSAAGLSPGFMLTWACAGVPLGVYNITSNFNIALQIQPQILSSLSLITWGQCCRYERSWSWPRVGLAVALAMCALGSVETGLVFAVRAAVVQNILWPKTLLAVLSAVLLVAGVAEQYVAILKTHGVEGVSFLFCGLDAMGDVTSVISVLYGPHLDILGLCIYSVELLFWLGIFGLGTYYKGWPYLKQLFSQRSATSETANEPSQVTSSDASSSTSVFQVNRADARRRQQDAGHPDPHAADNVSLSERVHV